MTYQTPVVEVIGSASELIQLRQGQGTDGGPVGFNKRVAAAFVEE